MEIVYTSKGQVDVKFWKKSGNKSVMDKISALLLSINESPYSGTGKPEALKHNLSGLWSRRINQEHRLIYEVLPDKIVIHSLKGHYN